MDATSRKPRTYFCNLDLDKIDHRTTIYKVGDLEVSPKAFLDFNE